MSDFAPLGPSGINARMAELQAKLDQQLGVTPAQTSANFSGALKDAQDGKLAPFGIGAPGIAIQSEAPEKLRGMIQNAAESNGVDADLLDAVVKQESGYNINARSHVGAMGLTQLMPGTASGLGVTDPFDPAQNLNAGAKYLKQQIDKFGDVKLALAAYNAGPGAVQNYGGVPPYTETQNYVKSIMAHYQKSKEIG